jgi:hypothetical protein
MAIAFDALDAQHHPEIGVYGFENDSPRQAGGYIILHTRIPRNPLRFLHT